MPAFQQDKNHCGPAALASVLQWTGLKVQPEDLIAHAFTEKLEGTLQNDMIAAARRQGRLAMVISKQSDALEEVAAGHPLIVLQNLGLSWYPRWHYSVLVGYDRVSQNVYLLSGDTTVREMPFDTFANTWTRAKSWALLVLPSTRLPVTQRELDVTTAAVAIETGAGPAAAQPYYEAILKKWPKNIGARFGLSNTRYALDDAKGAIRELKVLVSEVPGLAPAWHNLSLLLKEQGQFKEAQHAALKAQETASPTDKEKYSEQFKKD